MISDRDFREVRDLAQYAANEAGLRLASIAETARPELQVSTLMMAIAIMHCKAIVSAESDPQLATVIRLINIMYAEDMRKVIQSIEKESI